MSKIAMPMMAESPAGPRDPAPTSGRRPQVLLVTGLSGAGHTTALKILEDIGYEAVDNLPLSLLSALTRSGNGFDRPIAIGVDSRTRDFSADALADQLDRLKADAGSEVRLIFLTCSDETLQRRFTETRRRHPLALDRPVADGIRNERLLMAPLRERADLVVDTTDLAINDLRQVLRGHFTLDRKPGAAIAVVSFSYRHGLPREADLVFDVRFLRNPHYEPSMRDLTGQDAEVGRFVEADPAFGPFFESMTGLLLPLLPCFEREGKSYLTIAVGCTGGRHRSVFTAERLAEWLRNQGQEVSLRHRDVARTAGKEL